MASVKAGTAAFQTNMQTVTTTLAPKEAPVDPNYTGILPASSVSFTKSTGFKIGAIVVGGLVAVLALKKLIL